MLQEYNIQDGESVFDVVLKLYGSLELYGKYIQDNGPLGIVELLNNINQQFTFSPSFIFSLDSDSITISLSGADHGGFVTYATNNLVIGQKYIFSASLDSIIDPSPGLGAFAFYVLASDNSATYYFENVGETNVPGIISFAFTARTNSFYILVASDPGNAHGRTLTFSQLSVTQSNFYTTAIYDPSLYVSSPAELTQSSVIPSTIKMLLGQEGQSVYDLCLMTYGDIGQIYQLLQDSGIDSINETALSQQLFTYDTTFISDNTFYNYVSAEGIVMNTGEGNLVGFNYLEQQDFNYLLQENGFRITTI